MAERTYPRVTTLRGLAEYPMRPLIEVQYEAGGSVERYCGESWCRGSCGLPALIIPAEADGRYPELKVYSSMVACGRTVQAWRVEWRGPKVEVPAQYHAAFHEMMWL